jgi:hypothetical protein
VRTAAQIAGAALEKEVTGRGHEAEDMRGVMPIVRRELAPQPLIASSHDDGLKFTLGLVEGVENLCHRSHAEPATEQQYRWQIVAQSIGPADRRASPRPLRAERSRLPRGRRRPEGVRRRR